jgi:cell division protease FtsH
MVVLMAGRAAESLAFSEISTGAADDLAKATDLARDCVTRYGMSDSVGQAVLEEQRLRYLGDQPLQPRRTDYSETTAREVDLAVRGLVDEAYSRAASILDGKRALLDEGAALLLEKETLTPADFAPLRREPATPPAEAADAP